MNSKSNEFIEEQSVTKQVERAVGISLEELACLYLLDSIKGFGPQKFKALYEHKISPQIILGNPDYLPFNGKIWDGLRTALKCISPVAHKECHTRAVSQILQAQKNNVVILSYSHSDYPQIVFHSNNPIPILFVKGKLGILGEKKTVACVGSRKIRPPYDKLEENFVSEAIAQNFVIISGFATGADRIGHEIASLHGGKTICVMPCGLDTSFPPENRDLHDRLVNYDGAAFVSEFGFGVRANSLTLRKRNKLIVAFAQGVLIAQSDTKGGAMNAYRFALEQHKPVATFASDLSPETSGNALIAQDNLFDYGRFPLEPARNSYSQWLQQLSSLT